MLAEVELIKGQVARILDDRKLAINRGAVHGVTLDMKFKVLQTIESDVVDPESGEVIGHVEFVKVFVTVREVHNQMAIASTYRTERVNVGGVGAAISFAQLFEPPKWVDKVETLKLDEDQKQELAQFDPIVRVGDSVVQSAD